MNQNDFPNNIEIEKQVLGAMLIRDGEIIPKLLNIINADDFFHSEHKVIFKHIVQLYCNGVAPDVVSLIEDIMNSEDAKGIDLSYVHFSTSWTFTNAYALHHAKIVKEKSDLRKVIQSALELFTKTTARNLFLRDKSSSLTAADIRRGGWTNELDNIIDNVANSNLNLQVLELQDESIDDLLNLIRPLCANSRKAPIVCLDYLQIVPHNKDNIKLGIDDSVRKLKKFQRDTNTTFIVISSFNRTNYNQSVSFESFKESGGIEYSADVVWALQLYIMNQIKGGSDISQTRKKIDYAKKQQPRHIHLKCLKNRQGSNYDCFFQYFSAHDYFMPCNEDDFQTEEKDDF